MPRVQRRRPPPVAETGRSCWGQRPARRACRSRHDADAGSRNPASGGHFKSSRIKQGRRTKILCSGLSTYALCKIFLCAAGGIIDAVPQLVQRIKLFAGAQVGVELHHRVGAVQVAGKARDKGLAGHLGGIIVHGRAAAQTSGRGIPHPVDAGAGDINAAAGHLEALRVQLVDGGHPEGVSQPCPCCTAKRMA